MPDRLVDAIADMREGDAIGLAKQMLAQGTDPLQILDSCRSAVEIVGKRFEMGEYFLPELILAGETLKQITACIKPYLHAEHAVRKRGRVLIGTVKGDIHDLGKDIVVFMLNAHGFEVHDLGVDVPASRFVERIQEIQPGVVGLSGLLTVAADAMRETVDAIQAAGLRNSLKVMVGGGMTDEHVRVMAGADAFGADAIAAVSLAEQWTGGK